MPVVALITQQIPRRGSRWAFSIPGMAVTPPQPKSQPDLAKLNGFTGHMVQVTKHLNMRTTNGQQIVAPSTMKLQQILDLMTTLPMQHGPGYYLFSVSDPGGTGEDSWMVRLGPEQPQQEGFSMPGAPTTPFSPPNGATAPVGPLSEGVRQIGPGYFYDENLGTLVTPWREICQWRPGEPLPKPPTPNAAAAPAVPNPAWAGSTAWPPGSGWGGYPVNDTSSDKIKELEARLAEERRQRELDNIREENRRQAEETRRREEERERRQEERDRLRDEQFKALVATLAAKPTGPSESEQRLQRELDDQRRRNEEREREEARRREEDAKEARWRAEMKAEQQRTEVLLREASEKSRVDPMLTLMTTMLSSTQAQAVETVRTMREASERASAANERHTAQIVEAMKTDRTGAAEMAHTMLENTKSMVELQSSVYQQMLENASAGGQPWYADAIQNVTRQIGAVASAVAARGQQAQQQPQQRMAPVPAPRVAGPAITRPIPAAPRAVPLPVMPPAPPAANTTGDRPPGTTYDGNTDEFVLPGGHRVKSSVVQTHGWEKTIDMLAQGALPDPVAAARAAAPPVLTVVPPAPPPAAAEMNGAAGPAHAPATGKQRGNGRKPPSRGRRSAAAEPPLPPPAPPAVEIPPPADPARGYSMDELKALTTEQILALLSSVPDEQFFGPSLAPFVQQLREAMPEPATAAQFIAQGYQQMQAQGERAPATDLLTCGQLNALVERLFPTAHEEYKDNVALEIATAFGMPIEGEEGDEEDEAAGGDA